MDETLDEDFGLAEPEHLETMFDALIDTVSGNESLSLTVAQSYAMSVLGSSGMATRADMVTGVEGFFSAIGTGASKVWEYIKKMFQGIWNWFFGKKEKPLTITEQTEAMIKANQESLQAWAANDAVNREKFRESMKGMDASIADFLKTGGFGGSSKAEAEKAREQIAEMLALPPGSAPRYAKEVMAVVVKLNSRTQQAMDELCKRALADHSQYTAIVNEDHTAAFAGTIYAPNYHLFKDWAKEFSSKSIEPLVSIPKGMSRIEDGAHKQAELLKVISMLKSEIGAISTSFKSDAIAKQKHLEEVLNKPNLQNDGKFKKDLAACKLFLSLTTRHIKQLEKTQETVKRLSNMIMRLFGLTSAK